MGPPVTGSPRARQSHQHASVSQGRICTDSVCWFFVVVVVVVVVVVLFVWVLFVCLFVCFVLFCFVLFFGYLTSHQHASVSQGRICTDNSCAATLRSCRSNFLPHPVTVY